MKNKKPYQNLLGEIKKKEEEKQKKRERLYAWGLLPLLFFLAVIPAALCGLKNTKGIKGTGNDSK